MANDFQPSEMLCSKDYKKEKTVDFDYNINGHILETVTSNPYLGAELTNTMSWDKQVQKVVTKGNKASGFIRRNVGSCPEEVKKQAYLALVRLHLEYASIGTLISKNIFNRLRWSNAEQHASSKASTQETLVQ